MLSNGSVNTKAGTHDYHTTFGLGMRGDYMVVDDLYVLDGTGAVNNDLLGVRKVVTIFPNAAGDVNDWTGSSGADHYTLVDENPVDDDTTYIESSTSSQEELWNYTDPASIASVSGIQISTDCRLTDVSPITLETQVKSGSTDSSDAGQVPSGTSYSTVSRIVELNPDTSSAWDATSLNSAQFGVKVA